jgi:hypothetical protein
MSNDNHKLARECGPGWNDLIGPIVIRADETGATIVQIKEKFGMLRIYLGPGDVDCDELLDMIDKAEMESATTCEMCGKPGVTMATGSNGHWLKTLCKEHGTELGYRRTK